MQQTGVSLAEKIELRWSKETKIDSQFVQSSAEAQAEGWWWWCSGSQRLPKAADSSGRKGGEYVYCLPFELPAKGSRLCQKL